MKLVLARVFRQPLGLSGYWLYRVLAAWVLTAPLVAAFGGAGVGRLPTGDAGLFEPGGLLLVEALRLAGPSIGAQGRTASITALGLLYLGLIPLGVLLVALRASEPLRPREWFGTSLTYLPRLSLWLGLTLTCGVIVLLGGAAVMTPLTDTFRRSFDARTADLATLAIGVPFALLFALLGVTHDVGRAVVVCEDQRFVASLKKALSVVLRRGGRLLLVWLGGAALGALVVLIASSVTSRLEVERPEAWRWLTVLALHQAIVLFLVLLRACWLAYVTLVSERHPTRSSEASATGPLLSPPEGVHAEVAS